MDAKKEEELEFPTSASPGQKSELFGDTYALGATVELFIKKLQENRMVDPRWVAIAKTHFQEGLSAARRAVMNNDRF